MRQRFDYQGRSCAFFYRKQDIGKIVPAFVQSPCRISYFSITLIMSHPRSSWADASDSDSSPANSPTLRPKPSNTSNVDDSFFDAPNLREEKTTNNGSNHSNGNNRRNNRDNNNNRDRGSHNNRDNDRNHSRDNNHSNNRNTGDPARDNNCDNNRNNVFPTRREERPKETRNFDDNWRRSAPSMPSAARDNRDGRDSEARYKDRSSRQNPRPQNPRTSNRDRDRGARQSKPLPYPTEAPFSAFFGNLGPLGEIKGVSEEELKKFVESLGVEKVDMNIPSDTLKAKQHGGPGFGYVTFENLSDLQTIVEMARSNSNVLDFSEGRKVKVELPRNQIVKKEKEKEKEGEKEGEWKQTGGGGGGGSRPKLNLSKRSKPVETVFGFAEEAKKVAEDALQKESPNPKSKPNTKPEKKNRDSRDRAPRLNPAKARVGPERLPAPVIPEYAKLNKKEEKVEQKKTTGGFAGLSMDSSSEEEESD
ncbi:hypothetical protein TL16_g11135 [Triparma laevis f. inornata]|uniref:RRM domain-containing protein n=1 Tax=Triparma laevis f. inornata TaxID=1714386 RepID=A0A9W7ER01_9STRA|nr:hypothetical protein TL16_g11135 [Triparma laevis f. inornata]